MFKGQHHESRKSLSLLLTLEHAYCKKSQLLRGTFCFTQVQGPNALTTLLHLADVLLSRYCKKKVFLVCQVRRKFRKKIPLHICDTLCDKLPNITFSFIRNRFSVSDSPSKFVYFLFLFFVFVCLFFRLFVFVLFCFVFCLFVCFLNSVT